MRAPDMKILHTCKTLYIALHYTHYIIYIKNTLQNITWHYVKITYSDIYISIYHTTIQCNIHSIYIQYRIHNI